MKSKPSFKCALVTGATTGLGAALVKLLKEKGIEIITTDRTDSALPIDLRGSRQKLLELITEKKPDLVINNAGFGFLGNSIDLGIQEQLDMIEVNDKALVEISIHAAKTMVKAGQKGTILNVSSVSAYLYSPMFNVYHATKAFVKSFSLGFNAELRNQGIKVLCTCPGRFDSKFAFRATKGAQKKTELGAMSTEFVANTIWKQIESGKRIWLFDWRYKLLVVFSKLIPDVIVERIEKKMWTKRLTSSSQGTSRANGQK